MLHELKKYVQKCCAVIRYFQLIWDTGHTNTDTLIYKEYLDKNIIFGECLQDTVKSIVSVVLT